MNEDLAARCRQAFEAQADTRDLIKEFAKLEGNQRIAAWTQMCKGGVNDLDFVKFVHRNFGRLVLEVFGTPEQAMDLYKAQKVT